MLENPKFILNKGGWDCPVNIQNAKIIESREINLGSD